MTIALIEGPLVAHLLAVRTLIGVARTTPMDYSPVTAAGAMR
jgi:hypothetical protein